MIHDFFALSGLNFEGMIFSNKRLPRTPRTNLVRKIGILYQRGQRESIEARFEMPLHPKRQNIRRGGNHVLGLL